MTLPALFDTLTDATFAALGTAGVLRPAAGGEAPVRVIFRRSDEDELLESARVVRGVPRVRIPFVDAPDLKKGDVVAIDGEPRLWRLAEAPQRPGQGRVWRAMVEDLGAAA